MVFDFPPVSFAGTFAGRVEENEATEHPGSHSEDVSSRAGSHSEDVSSRAGSRPGEDEADAAKSAAATEMEVSPRLRKRQRREQILAEHKAQGRQVLALVLEPGLHQGRPGEEERSEQLTQVSVNLLSIKNDSCFLNVQFFICFFV